MPKRLFVNSLFLCFILIFLFVTTCYAVATPVTKKNLKEAFKKFVESEENEGNYKISVSDNTIDIIVDNETYTLNYNLTGKPTFSVEMPIQKGMSYEEFKKKTDNLILPILGYIAVANIQGVEMEDAAMYGMLSYLGNALNGSISTENSYIIIDDLNLEEGVTIEKNNNSNTIYASEFGDRVMEYVNNMYKEKQLISDSTGINSYLMTVEKLETTEESCKLVGTLSVDLNADFSKIKGYSNQLGGNAVDGDITKENADYVITLKVGQKCKIETSGEVNGYGLFGGCVEFSEDKTEIKAKTEGQSNGYFYVGDIKKTFYITVEGNPDNTALNTITLKVDATPAINQPNKITENEQEGPKQEEKNENAGNKDNTTSNSNLSNTGLENTTFFIAIICIAFCLISGIKLIKNKDVK